ncbi:hypothetical protein THAOC_20415, partial [Thalassiosira oceanica]
KQKKEMRQLANGTPAEIIRGIHEGKPGATLALATRFDQSNGLPYDELKSAGMTEALLKNLKRCDESLAPVFGVSPSDQDAICLPYFCLSMLLTVGRQSHNRQEVCLHIAEGISPVIKCMVHERRVFFQSTESWFESMEDFINLIQAIVDDRQVARYLLSRHGGLLPFLGQAICWSQCRQDIVEGFSRLNMTVPQEAIISAAHSICFFLLRECQHDVGIPVPKACEMLRTVGAVTMAEGSELPAIVGMIRLYGEMCRARYKVLDLRSRNELADIIPSLIWSGCVDEIVMSELAVLHDACPEFVARCSSKILFLSGDSCVAGALRSGLFATTLSICAQLGRQDVHGGLESVMRADALASGMIDLLYKIRLHNKTHKVLGSMTPFNFQGMEDKLEHIFRDARESACANCLEAFDSKALKWCKGTHMLEPFCSRECLMESWDAGACADFGDIFKKDDNRRSISLKRNILQAGYEVLHGSIGSIVGEHFQGMARGQGLTIAINLMEFPSPTQLGATTS